MMRAVYPWLQTEGKQIEYCATMSLIITEENSVLVLKTITCKIWLLGQSFDPSSSVLSNIEENSL